MTILILAGGVSKRMWPLTGDKLLLPFLGKPFFFHTLKALKEAKNDLKVVIVANNSNHAGLTKIAEELGVNAEIVMQAEPKGMSDAILAASDKLSGPILIMNGDDLVEPKLYTDLLNQLETSPSEINLVGRVVEKYFDGGYIQAPTEGNNVTGIIEKPGPDSPEYTRILKLVVDYFKDASKLLETLKTTTSDKDDVYEKALDTLIKNGAQTTVTRYEGAWSSIKYPWHVLSVMDILLSRVEQKISPEAQIAKNATIEGNVVIESGVKVFENAVIKGPAYIGPNSIIGTNSLVRNSILEECVVTGYCTEIARSYVGADSWFHTNYVGDSIIEGDFGMGSGAVIANLRLDSQTIRVLDNTIDTGLEKLGVIAGTGARIGVNATTMPGVMLGTNTLVGPNVSLNKNLSEGKRILAKQELEESDNKTNTSYGQFRENLDK